jgi:DNA-binding NarL/FixJ family response regulator
MFTAPRSASRRWPGLPPARSSSRALLLLGAADALRTSLGMPVASFGHMSAHHEMCERQVRTGLGEAAFAAALGLGLGQALSHADAIAYALGVRWAPADRPTPLTRREHEVSGLIADGLSNREIAGALVVSRRTVDSHVGHILAKRGVASRVQVAAWHAGQRPGS